MGEESSFVDQRLQKRRWQKPWRHRESLLIALLLLAGGFLLEVLTPDRGIDVPGFPHNVLAILVFATTLLFLHIFYRKSSFVRWLTGVPAAISAILLLSVVALMLGIVKQENVPGSVPTILGLTHVTNSWMLVMAQLFLLTVLGLVILKRSRRINRRNTGFLLNHAGLWIVIVAASLGSGDLQRLRMELQEGETVWYAYDEQQRVYELPFAVMLQEFHIEEYPPKIALVDIRTGTISEEVNRPFPEAGEGTEATILNYHLVVEEFIEEAWPADGGFVESERAGSPPAALITVESSNTDTLSGWISSGSYIVEPRFLHVSEEHVLAMTRPEPKKYQSFVRIYTEDREPYNEVIEVNDAPKVMGWHLYQLSYDQQKGKWSTTSVVEIVKDPWLYVVYAGIVLLFAGALYLLWFGKEQKTTGGTSGRGSERHIRN